MRCITEHIIPWSIIRPSIQAYARIVREVNQERNSIRQTAFHIVVMKYILDFMRAVSYTHLRRRLIDSARLSLLRGNTASKAMRLSSRNSFQPVPSTSPIIFCLFMLGP